MKRYIKAGFETQFKGNWSEEDKENWYNTDWKAQNYNDLIVDSDTIRGEVVVYGLPGGTQYKPATFVKHICANSIYSPHYEPLDDASLTRFIKNNHLVGPMYDGNVRNGYKVMNAYETSERYERMSR